VVIIDIDMPRIGGYEAAEAIRQAMGNDAPLLIAISGHFGRADPAIVAIGFDLALPKPIDMQRLREFLLRDCQGASRSSKKTGSTGA